MQASKRQFKTIDEYIAKFPKDTRDVLEELRRVIKETAPKADETISYGMPAFRLDGKIVVYFAAHKNHVGFYPTSSPIRAFEKELTPYRYAKGSVQFPLGKPIPLVLVEKMVSYRAKEIESKKSRT